MKQFFIQRWIIVMLIIGCSGVGQTRQKELPAISHGSLKQEIETSLPGKLSQIKIEVQPMMIKIQCKATAGLKHFKQEKLHNPGRLVLEFDQLVFKNGLERRKWSDGLLIPRIRIVKQTRHPQIVIDSVLAEFPPYVIQVSDQLLTILVKKIPEQMAEARKNRELYLALEKNEQGGLKLGTQEGGGILFKESSEHLQKNKKSEGSR